jgi:hypothetical protein
METNGVKRAIVAAGSQAALGDALGVTKQFIGKSERKGWLPLERAQTASQLYGIALVDLVRPDIAAAMRAQSA